MKKYQFNKRKKYYSYQFFKMSTIIYINKTIKKKSSVYLLIRRRSEEFSFFANTFLAFKREI